MEIKMKQISSMEKARTADNFQWEEIHRKKVLAGERVSYQICVKSDCRMGTIVSVESSLSEYVRLYQVRDACMDLPVRDKRITIPEEDYITLEPGLMPDILVPLKEQDYRLKISAEISTVWVKVDIPKNMKPGSYEVRISIAPDDSADGAVFEIYETMTIEVVPAVMPEQKLMYTRWFYADCIAVQHNVEIYSEKHWELIDKYIAAAADVGINMILVPIHTPPLDTAVGATRPCVQLVDIEKEGSEYRFSFERFQRFIDICKKNGIEYFEMAHMFSQWGAKCAPNIMVTENGKKDYMFGWHVAANSPEYISFLKQYIGAISQELEREGISKNTYFHISDEPLLEVMDTYRTAFEIIQPLIGNSKTFDALSSYEYYERGLVSCPVTYMHYIHDFLEHEIENQWVYYCGGPEVIFTNSHIAMPSRRTRILGFLLYKYRIKGFLHWGFNFYNSDLSYYAINPYFTTSCDRSYPSGDPFIVYPGKDGVYPSIRGEITYEAIQDMDICFALEERIGRDAVVEMIDRAAGRDLRFDDYPRSDEFFETLRSQMVEKISELWKMS